MAIPSQDTQLENLATNLNAPKKIQTDSGTVEQHSLEEQIKAVEFVQKNQSGRKSSLSRVGFYQVVNQN